MHKNYGLFHKNALDIIKIVFHNDPTTTTLERDMTSFKTWGTWLGGLLLAAAATAQTYPSKPVTLMVPYPAGGLSDVIARTVNTTLSKNLGQPVIVENLGGASGRLRRRRF